MCSNADDTDDGDDNDDSVSGGLFCYTLIKSAMEINIINALHIFYCPVSSSLCEIQETHRKYETV
jgi:hypothetical protein